MDKLSPLVTVIMNCKNGKKFIKESVNSLLNQTYKNWELIFWDNASTDKSLEILKLFNDKRIFFFKNKKASTLGEARKKALKKAKGKFICILDDIYV